MLNLNLPLHSILIGILLIASATTGTGTTPYPPGRRQGLATWTPAWSAARDANCANNFNSGSRSKVNERRLVQ